MTVLVLGRNGLVARALQRRAKARGIALECVGRPDFDLQQPESVAPVILSRRPAVVINAAAYTAVDQAEDDRERAFVINGEGAGAAAAAAASVGAAFLHLSTDYVFSGDKPEPYREEDETGPQGVYGASKLRGEQLSLAAHENAIVVRTAWVFDKSGANFVRTMLRLARERTKITVVSDQLGCPTYAMDLADALITISQRPDRGGVFHCAGRGDTSWADFARAIFAGAKERGGPVADVVDVSSAHYPTRAKRPANSRLDCEKLAADYGLQLRPWNDALIACLDEIAESCWSVA